MLAEHPAEFGNGLELLEGVWIGFLAVPTLLLLLFPLACSSKQELIILNRKSIDIVSSQRGRPIEISSMDWGTTKAIVHIGGDSVSVELRGSRTVRSFGVGEHNFLHFCAHLLRVAPEGALTTDPRGRQFIEDNAKAAEGKLPAFP